MQRDANIDRRTTWKRISAMANAAIVVKAKPQTIIENISEHRLQNLF